MLGRFYVALTKDDYVSALGVVTAELGKRDPMRDRRIWEQIGASALLFLVLTFTFRDAGWAVVVTILAASFVVSALGTRWMRKSFGASYDPATAHFTVAVSEQGIVEKNRERTRKWLWAAVRQVHDTGAVLVFETDGWDMLILPSRLWPDDASKAAFLRQAREQVPPRAGSMASAPVRAIADPAAHDQLRIAAIAVGLDMLFAVGFLIPRTDGTMDAPVVIMALLMGTVAGYFAYRLARHFLPQLYAQAPRATQLLTQVLIFAVPLYMVASYLGWINV